MARNFRPILLSPLGLLPLAAGQSDAADLPVKARTPAVEPYLPLWTGWYVGGHLGMVADKSRQSPFLATPTGGGVGYCWASTCTFSNSQTATGILGGLQFGYNFQNGPLVYGVELDASFSNAKKTVTGAHATGGLTWTAETGVEFIGTARLRLGYAFNWALIYGTGGVAYADMRNAFTAGVNTAFQQFTTSDTGWRVGYAVGGGAEFAVARNWSVKIEGLYYDLGSEDHVSSDNFGSAWGLHDRMTGVIGRAGVNYHFR
jgi:outer membrane immunogenic protein